MLMTATDTPENKTASISKEVGKPIRVFIIDDHPLLCKGVRSILEREGDHVKTESNFQVTRTMVDGAMAIFACGRSLDTFFVGCDEIKLSERIVILDSRQIDTLLVIPL